MCAVNYPGPAVAFANITLLSPPCAHSNLSIPPSTVILVKTCRMAALIAALSPPGGSRGRCSGECGYAYGDRPRGSDGLDEAWERVEAAQAATEEQIENLINAIAAGNISPALKDRLRAFQGHPTILAASPRFRPCADQLRAAALPALLVIVAPHRPHLANPATK